MPRINGVCPLSLSPPKTSCSHSSPHIAKATWYNSGCVHLPLEEIDREIDYHFGRKFAGASRPSVWIRSPTIQLSYIYWTCMFAKGWVNSCQIQDHFKIPGERGGTRWRVKRFAAVNITFGPWLRQTIHIFEQYNFHIPAFRIFPSLVFSVHRLLCNRKKKMQRQC